MWMELFLRQLSAVMVSCVFFLPTELMAEARVMDQLSSGDSSSDSNSSSSSSSEDSSSDSEDQRAPSAAAPAAPPPPANHSMPLISSSGNPEGGAGLLSTLSK